MAVLRAAEHRLQAECEYLVAAAAAVGEAGQITPVIAARLADLEHLRRHGIDVFGTQAVRAEATQVRHDTGLSGPHDARQRRHDEDEETGAP